MSGTAAPGIDVNIGDVRESQLVIGDYTTVQTAKGTKVTIVQVGDRPVPHLRRLPISQLPTKGVEVLGREPELALAGSASAESPLQVCGREGAGKTALLKCMARAAQPPADGVLFASARRRDFDELRSRLYNAFWETKEPFLPSPAEVGDYLGDRQALIVLDDCGLDRDDLDALLDSAPRSTLIVASEEQTLWSRGSARTLSGLDRDAGVALMESAVGRRFDPEERTAAAAIVDQRSGHPQALVEVAALVRDGSATLEQVSADPQTGSARVEELTASQRRILRVLAAVDGATLGVEHVAALAQVPDAARELEVLERRGWVKSQSPRYRLVRELADDPSADPALANRLLEHLTTWADGQATPSDVSYEAEAIEAALRLARTTQRWGGLLALASASERKLTVAGSWGSSRRVLSAGLEAARALASEPAEAQMLHERGSLALCLGDTPTAIAELGDALRIRERLGDAEGAAVTRHNLEQLGGGASANGGSSGDGGAGSGGSGSSGGGRRRWPGIGTALGVLGVLAAAAAGVLALTQNNDGKLAADTGPTPRVKPPPRPAPNKAPAIRLLQPTQGARFRVGATVHASYACSAARATKLASCRGSVASGKPVDTSAGRHRFEVTARDRDGLTTTLRIHYTVVPRTGPSSDTVRPAIHIRSPGQGPFAAGAHVLASFSCTDGGSGVASCGGTVPDRHRIDTDKPGSFEFTVTATDRAGNNASRTVTYTVVDRTKPTVSITIPSNGTAYHQNTEVKAIYTCTDSKGGSGIVDCAAPVDVGGSLNTTALGSFEFTVTATDRAGNKATRTARYTVVESTPPTITISSPKDGGRYFQGSPLYATYGCADESGGSGVATCSGPIPDGAQLNTDTPGTYTFKVTATDNAGNPSDKQATYTVVEAPR